MGRRLSAHRSWFLDWRFGGGPVLTGPFVAGAEEVTRTDYREAAEPICKRNTEANERILGGVRDDVR